mmetsp:Transcript_99314/g.228000  ORF Transcript_99314/g.228000 Transcript_99314/m.228000 type:complete len:111 (-) Transcript_99314:2676-3008(-)
MPGRAGPSSVDACSTMAQHNGLAGAVPREASLKQSIRESSVAREPRERFAPGHCSASAVSISFIVFHVLDSVTNFTVFFLVVDMRSRRFWYVVPCLACSCKRSFCTKHCL